LQQCDYVGPYLQQQPDNLEILEPLRVRIALDTLRYQRPTKPYDRGCGLKRLSRVAASFKINPHHLGLPRKIAENEAGLPVGRVAQRSRVYSRRSLHDSTRKVGCNCTGL